MRLGASTTRCTGRAASQATRCAWHLQLGFRVLKLNLTGPAGARCQHNQVYWAASQPYHAFGLGASSLVGARRFARPRSMRAYRAWVEGFLAAGGGVPGACFGLHSCLIKGPAMHQQACLWVRTSRFM